MERIKNTKELAFWGAIKDSSWLNRHKCRYRGGHNGPPEEDCNTEIEEVIGAMKLLKRDKAAGHDGITPEMKMCLWSSCLKN